MAYLIDRGRAVRMAEIVAILSVRRRRVRSRVVMRDNSLYHTLTRPRTLVRYTRHGGVPAVRARNKEFHGEDARTR